MSSELDLDAIQNGDGERIDEIARNHTSNGSTCDHCDDLWPCDAAAAA